MIYKLLGFTFAMAVVPIGSYFFTLKTVFNGTYPVLLNSNQHRRARSRHSCPCANLQGPLPFASEAHTNYTVPGFLPPTYLPPNLTQPNHPPHQDYPHPHSSQKLSSLLILHRQRHVLRRLRRHHGQRRADQLHHRRHARGRRHQGTTYGQDRGGGEERAMTNATV